MMADERKSLPPITLAQDVSILNNHGKADTVEISDPDGTRAVVLVNRLQRLYEKLHDKRVIDDMQRQAAEQLRDLWERGGLDVGDASALDPGRPSTVSRNSIGAARDIVRNDEAYAEYEAAMRALPATERFVVGSLVVHECDVRGSILLAGGNPGALLRNGLDRLVAFWGL